MSVLDLHLLHGFLGLPSDWNSVFPPSPLSYCCVAESLISQTPIKPFVEWAEGYNRKISATKSNGRKKVLLGYSMGGRLALQAINDTRHPWDAAILISTNPGIRGWDERKQRRDADEMWARRFEEEPWDTLMESWNSRGIFQNDSYRFTRSESEHRREDLARCLREWSLGRQQPFINTLCTLDIPILWMAGEKDTKLAAYAKEILLKHRLSEVCIMPEAGHRLPWEQPQQLLGRVNEFIKRLER